MTGPTAVVISCEHASFAVPRGVHLGVPRAIVRSHVGWDPGARDVAQSVAATLGAPAFFGRFTRLVVDLNRVEEGAIHTVAFGEPVPGNCGLTREERERRIARWHRPYRTAVREAVGSRILERGACLHVSVHSFTPVLGTDVREYDAGVLFDPARRAEIPWAERFLAALRAAGLDARPNVPYLGTVDGLTTWLRTVFADGTYAGIEIELSHRLDARARKRAAAAMAAMLS